MISPIFTYLLQSSICLGVLYAFYHVLLRDLPSFVWNRFYLLAMYAVSLTLPLLSFDVYPVYIENTIQDIITPVSETIIADGVVATQSNFDWFLGIYILTVILFLGRLSYNLWKTIAQIKNANRSIQENYTLVEGNSNDKVYSFFKYLIKPKGTVLHPEVIQHELTHIRQYHSIDLILSEIVKAVLWFNPFVYLSQKAIRINHEYICDDEASKINGRYKYAQLLSDISYKQSNLIYVNNFSYKLKNRIIMLQKIDSLTERKWRYALILPILFFGLHIYAFDTYRVVINYSDNQSILLDTIPYEIDTITVFDYDTYERTVKYEKYIMDTLTVIDADTYEETVTVKRRVIEEGPIPDDTNDANDIEGDRCYMMFWNNLNLKAERQWTTELIKESLKGEIDFASFYTDKCKSIRSWSLEVIVVPVGKDPQVQELSLDDNMISEKLLNDGYLVPGTRLFFENVTVNGNEIEGLKSVITIE